MKAKVNLIQVFIEKADIYLLDEPINGLDKDGVKCLINYLSSLLNNLLGYFFYEKITRYFFL